MIDIADTINFFTSIIEREKIFIRKELWHLPKEQYTDVPVYKHYRFCNVHRCYDKTFILLNNLDAKLFSPLHPGLRTMLRWTSCNPLIQWLIDNCTYNTEVAFALMNANKGYPEQLIAMILDAYHNGVIPLVTGSFIVKRYGDDYAEMLAYYKAGTDFYKELTEGRICTSKDAVDFFKKTAPWCADFGAYCIVSDWLYLTPEKFTDRYEWTAYGPGAFNGINLIIPTTKCDYLKHLQELYSIWRIHGKELLYKICSDLNLTPEGLDDLCKREGYLPMSKLLTQPLMLDVEHWLCEYAKYVRGWAKKKYK